jgi:hypothetical protein
LISLGFLPFAFEYRWPVGRAVGRFCSRLPPFQLSNRALGKRRITRKIVRVEDRAHAAQRVAGDGGDFGFGRARNRKPGDRCASQIMEREPDEADALAGAAPSGLEPRARPRFAIAFNEDTPRLAGADPRRVRGEPHIAGGPVLL